MYSFTLNLLTYLAVIKKDKMDKFNHVLTFLNG